MNQDTAVFDMFTYLTENATSQEIIGNMMHFKMKRLNMNLWGFRCFFHNLNRFDFFQSSPQNAADGLTKDTQTVEYMLSSPTSPKPSTFTATWVQVGQIKTFFFIKGQHVSIQISILSTLSTEECNSGSNMGHCIKE